MGISKLVRWKWKSRTFIFPPEPSAAPQIREFFKTFLPALRIYRKEAGSNHREPSHASRNSWGGSRHDDHTANQRWEHAPSRLQPRNKNTSSIFLLKTFLKLERDQKCSTIAADLKRVFNFWYAAKTPNKTNTFVYDFKIIKKTLF